MDSHNVQRYITPQGFVQNEGDIGVKPPAPYSISYGSLTPQKINVLIYLYLFAYLVATLLWIDKNGTGVYDIGPVGSGCSLYCNR